MDKKMLNHIRTSIISDPKRVRTDSRDVCSGDVFIALRGPLCDGHAFIPDAAKRGAAIIVCEDIRAGMVSTGTEVVIVPDTRLAAGEIARYLYGEPSDALWTCGITGTNGKTTSAFLIRHILEAAGKKCGMISTVCSITDGDTRDTSVLTTPGIFEINRFLSLMRKNGKDSAVFEVSSHALDQGRTEGVLLDRALFTNLTPEHLDYHKDMEEYMRAKIKIFDMLKPVGKAVVNSDDPLLGEAIESLDRIPLITFGIGVGHDVSACGIKSSERGTEFNVDIKGKGNAGFFTSLPGEHNVYNVLGALAVLNDSGIELSVMKDAVRDFSVVPGRFERIEHSGAFNVFVDYAHTPDALENVLKCLRGLTENKVICVFGCGGDRDQSKRPVMGKIAVSFSDHVFLTNDNPRTEDPEKILLQIEKGIMREGGYSIISSRRDAIFNAIKMAGPGDSVIIAGKGHEDYQILGTGKIHFDDREAAGEALKEMGYR